MVPTFNTTYASLILRQVYAKNSTLSNYKVYTVAQHWNLIMSPLIAERKRKWVHRKHYVYHFSFLLLRSRYVRSLVTNIMCVAVRSCWVKSDDGIHNWLDRKGKHIPNSMTFFELEKNHRCLGSGVQWRI